MLEATSENFYDLVLSCEKPVLVDVWAVWCPPCKLLAPIFKSLSQEMTDVVFVKLDYDAHPELAEYHGVRSLPTLLLFRNGEVKDRFIGLKSRATIAEWLKAAIV